jgi:hypothetical protein
MHRCLDVQEIILIIFHLTTTKRDLAALAVTCKTFRDPALEILWSELNEFSPLARCLPNDIWKEEIDSQPSSNSVQGSGPVLTVLV